MSADPNLASLAALITEPARAAMLSHLLDGRAWTGGELAKVAGVGAPTASAHLRKLLDGNLVRASTSGRHRYFRLADPQVADWRVLRRRAASARPEKSAPRKDCGVVGFVTTIWPARSVSRSRERW